jgi:hypothetical protein
MNDKGLGDYVFYAEAGVERGEGVLEDDLHVAAELAHLAARGGEQVATVEADAAGGGLDEAEDEASEGALAGAGFADQAEGFSGMNVEGDVVDGANFAAGFSAEGRLGVRENFGEVADFDQGHDAMVAAPWPRIGTDFHGYEQLRLSGGD